MSLIKLKKASAPFSWRKTGVEEVAISEPQDLTGLIAEDSRVVFVSEDKVEHPGSFRFKINAGGSDALLLHLDCGPSHSTFGELRVPTDSGVLIFNGPLHRQRNGVHLFRARAGMLENRRAYERIPTNLDVSVSYENNDGETISLRGLMLNLSLGGALIETSDELIVGDLYLTVEHGGTRYVFSAQAVGQDGNRLHLQFRDGSKEAAKLLLEQL